MLKVIFFGISAWITIFSGIEPWANASGIPDPGSILSPAAANALVKSIGIGMDHRSYEPASAMGTAIGIAIGLEVTLIQPPSDLGSSLGGIAGASGGSSSSAAIPILPAFKLHFHKGLGENLDVGISALPPIGSLPLVGKSLLIGGDVKLVVFRGEEGPTWAIRGSYNVNSFSYSQSGQELTIKTATFAPQVLVSRKLNFADPYIGLGLQYTYGSVKASVPVPDVAGQAIAPVELTQSGSGIGAQFFCGIDLKVPNIGLRITLEGSYSPFGMNSLGSKIGLAF